MFGIRRTLEASGVGVKLVAAKCGFGSADSMRRSFLRVLDTTPSEVAGAHSTTGVSHGTYGQRSNWRLGAKCRTVVPHGLPRLGKIGGTVDTLASRIPCEVHAMRSDAHAEHRAVHSHHHGRHAATPLEERKRLAFERTQICARTDRITHVRIELMATAVCLNVSLAAMLSVIASAFGPLHGYPIWGWWLVLASILTIVATRRLCCALAPLFWISGDAQSARERWVANRLEFGPKETNLRCVETHPTKTDNVATLSDTMSHNAQNRTHRCTAVRGAGPRGSNGSVRPVRLRYRVGIA